jgi:hypothetical protein
MQARIYPSEVVPEDARTHLEQRRILFPRYSPGIDRDTLSEIMECTGESG